MMCSSLFAMQICTVHQLCQSDSVINQSSDNPLSDWQLRFQSASWLTTWVHILKTGYDNLDMIWTIWKFLLSVTLNESLNLHFMREGRVGGSEGGKILWDHSSEAKLPFTRDAAIESDRRDSIFAAAFLCSSSAWSQYDWPDRLSTTLNAPVSQWKSG